MFKRTTNCNPKIIVVANDLVIITEESLNLPSHFMCHHLSPEQETQHATQHQEDRHTDSVATIAQVSFTEAHEHFVPIIYSVGTSLLPIRWAALEAQSLRRFAVLLPLQRRKVHVLHDLPAPAGRTKDRLHPRLILHIGGVSESELVLTIAQVTAGAT